MDNKLCPFRKTMKESNTTVNVINTRFDDCYGERCMAWCSNGCRLFAPAVSQNDLELMRLKNRLSDLGMS